jgi:hypothetical protein
MSIHRPFLDLQDLPYFVSNQAPNLTVVGAFLRLHTTVDR